MAHTSQISITKINSESRRLQLLINNIIIITIINISFEIFNLVKITNILRELSILKEPVHGFTYYINIHSYKEWNFFHNFFFAAVLICSDFAI